MKKSKIFRVIASALAFAFISPLVTAPIVVQANENTPSDIQVLLNGQPLEFDVPPVIVSGRTMVPFRAIFEAFGADVSWEPETRQVSAIYQGDDITHIALTINEDVAHINGVPNLLDSVPFIASGRTLVPLRFISESLGADVDWDGAARVVTIETDDTIENTIGQEQFFGGFGLPNPDNFQEFIHLGEWVRDDPSVWNSVVGGYYFNFYGFRISESSYREAVAERDRILSQIIRPGMSEFEMVRTVHNWIVENVTYNRDYFDPSRFGGDGRNPNFRPVRYQFEHQTAWSALILRTVVCGGYADAFSFMLEPLGIANYYISGYASTRTWQNEYHAWNFVRIDGSWYHLDTTWARQYFGGYYLVGYDYFLLSDADMRFGRNSSREWNNSVTWNASSRPTAPRTFAFDRPELIWDVTLNRWRHRTADDDRTFNITATLSHEQAGNITITPNAARSGQWVTIQVHPNQGFEFERWEVVSGNITFQNQVGSWAVFMMPSSDVSLRAVFRQAQINNVTVSVNNQQWGTATANPASNISSGQWVTLNAIQNQGFEFSHWEVVSGSVNLQNANNQWTNFIMPQGDVSVRAVFRQIGQQSVTVGVNNTQWGTATANPNTNVTVGQQVALEARPNPGFNFSHWEVVSGNAQFQNLSSQSTSFTMPNGNVSVRAVFTQGGGNITVSSSHSSAGLVMASASRSSASVGESVHLSALDSHASLRFVRWEVVSGNLTLANPSSARLDFIMPSGDVHIRGIFEEFSRLEVTSNNAGWGTAQANFEANLFPGRHVELFVQPNAGFEFSHWEVVRGSVNINSTGSNIFAVGTFVMPEGEVHLRAIFRDIQAFSVNVSANNSQWGTVSTNHTTNVPASQDIQVRAQANQGFEFSHWEVISGGIVLQDSSSVLQRFPMPREDVSLRAIFRETQTFSLSISVNDSNRGSAAASGWFDNISRIPGGVQVSLQASSVDYHSFVFSHWEVVYGNVSIANASNFLTYFMMPSNNVSLRAVFIPRPGALNVTVTGSQAGGTATVSRTSGLSFGDWVTLNAQPRDGFRFSHWEVEENWWGFGNHIGNAVNVQNPTSPNTQFQMPAANVIVSAVFVEN